MIEVGAAVRVLEEAEERAGEGEDHDGDDGGELDDVREKTSEHQVEGADRMD